MSEVESLRDRPVILVCRTHKRSASAAVALRSADFRDIHVLRGGLEQWNRSGNPVEGLDREKPHANDTRPASETG